MPAALWVELLKFLASNGRNILTFNACMLELIQAELSFISGVLVYAYRGKALNPKNRPSLWGTRGLATHWNAGIRKGTAPSLAECHLVKCHR